jgi:hypothetical protein
MAFNISPKIQWEALHKDLFIYSPGCHPLVLVKTPDTLHYLTG